MLSSDRRRFRPRATREAALSRFDGDEVSPIFRRFARALDALLASDANVCRQARAAEAQRRTAHERLDAERLPAGGACGVHYRCHALGARLLAWDEVDLHARRRTGQLNAVALLFHDDLAVRRQK